MSDYAPARFVLASHNENKLRELQEILQSADIDPQLLINARGIGAPEPVEDGISFAENSLIKARALAAHTGLAAIADDSGLSVEILGGAPGIFSARWAGQHGDDAANLALLMNQLKDVAPRHRAAKFVCAAALVLPDGREIVEYGELPGTLTTQPRGEGGFGYDPILVPRGMDVTCAELSAQEKNLISHRGQAMRALLPHLRAVLAG